MPLAVSMESIAREKYVELLGKSYNDFFVINSFYILHSPFLVLLQMGSLIPHAMDLVF